MSDLRDRLIVAFRDNRDVIVRYKKGLFRDKIGAGLFRNRLEDLGFTTKEIRRAEEEGLLGINYIRLESGNVRLVYFYKPVIIGQIGYKKFIDKILSLWRIEKDE